MSRAHSVRKLFGRGKAKACGKTRRHRRRELSAAEALEQRLALAVAHFTGTGDGFAGNRQWVTIVGDGGSDIYAEQISPADPGQSAYIPSLLYADNASFLKYNEIKDINSYADVFVTNGTSVLNKALLGGRTQDSDGYPFVAPGSFDSRFVLQTDDVDAFEPISGTLSNGVGGRWTFRNIPGINGYQFSAQQFTAIGTPQGPNPKSAVIDFNGHTDGEASGDFDAFFRVTWDSNSLEPGGLSSLTPPILESITYDFDDNAGTGVPAFIRLSNIEATAPSVATYKLPLPTTLPALPSTTPERPPVYEWVPGSLSGKIDFSQWGQALEYNTLSQFADITDVRNIVKDANGNPVLNAAGQPVRSIDLVFRKADSDDAFMPRGQFLTSGLDDSDGRDLRLVKGTLTYVQDTSPLGVAYYRPALQFQFFAGVGNSLLTVPTAGGAGITDAARINFVNNADARIAGVQEVGRVEVTASYGIFNEPDITQPLGVVGGNFTLYDGQDFTRTLTVDLLAPGATISIESPIIYTAGTAAGASPANHFVDLRATNTILDAQVWSGTSFNQRDSFYGRAKSEQIFFNAANAARTYDIRVSDDPLTDNHRRSLVMVSTTGSLSGQLPTTPGIIPLDAESVYVRSDTGDVYVEGTIASTVQSYIMHSPIEKADPTDKYGLAHRAPYYLSNQSKISGHTTGLLRGGSVSVTLGNDVPTFYDDTLNGGASAMNVVTLETMIDSLRIQASDRAGNPLQTPFPYDLFVHEKDKLRVDGVAASSLPVAITAEGSITFNSSVLSASDITIDSLAGDLDLNVPITTTFGKITLAANRLAVGNSVRVLDTYHDSASRYVNDIVLTARAGNLTLTGPITALNTIELNQRSPQVNGPGSISGPTRIVADRVVARADGDINIKTDVAGLEATAGGSFTVDELNDIVISSLSSGSGVVSLAANGFDVAEGASYRSALTATLADATQLVTSAPNGSIDVRVTSADKVTLGNSIDIVRRTAKSMVAAGNVFIESAGGSIDVLDAPVGGGNAVSARVATTANLSGTYSQRSPGTFPSTLTANKVEPLVIDGVTVQVRDQILVKDQGNKKENGVYVVVSPGSRSSRWVLARAGAFDETREMPVYLRVGVAEGDTNFDRHYSIRNYVNTPTTTPRAVTTVLNRFDAIEVRAVSTIPLRGELVTAPDGLYQITSLLDEAIPLFDGVSLELGDLVLVRMGTVNASGQATTATNGLYRVSNVGSNLAQWVLTEVVDDDLNPIREGLFKSSEGSLRAKLTGNAFQVAYDSLGNSDMEIVEDLEAQVATKIGSLDANDVVRFITSTNLGTNTAVGSLGKMITLYNQNSYLLKADPVLGPAESQDLEQNQQFAFAGTLGGNIVLTQQLPRIERAVSMDATATRVAIGGAGRPEIAIDGSRISLKRNNAIVRPGDEVSGLELGASARRTHLNGSAFNADASRLAGMWVGGFARGAAVKLDGAADVTIDTMRIGQLPSSTGAAVRSSNLNGVHVYVKPGFANVANVPNVTNFNTLTNSWVYSSTASGVVVGAIDAANPTAASKIQSQAERLRVVNTQIGDSRFENAVGVNLLGGRTLLGVTSPTTSLPRVVGTVVNATTMRLPGTFTSIDELFVGLGVSSSAITVTTGLAAEIASVTPVRVDPTNPSSKINSYDVMIKNGTLKVPPPGQTPPPATFSFGTMTKVTKGDPTIVLPVGVGLDDIYIGQGVSVAGVPSGATITKVSLAFTGTTQMTRGAFTITLPEGMNYDRVFRGQSISGDGLPAGTTIVSKSLDANGVPVLTISRAATLTGSRDVTLVYDRPVLTLSKTPTQSGDIVGVVLSEAGRNRIGQNSRGVALQGGDNRVINADIYNSVFDGVVMTGAASNGKQVVGGGTGRIGVEGRPTSKDLAFTSNAIYGNGAAGILVNPALPVSQAVIQGNRLGVTKEGAVNVNKGGTNIVAPASYYGPVTGTVNPTLDLSMRGTVSGMVPSGTGLKDRTVTVTMAAHGLASGDTVRLRFAVTPLIDKAYSVTRVVDANTFVVTVLSADGAARLNLGTIVTRVRTVVTFTNHGLDTGRLVWLTITGTTPSTASQAFKIVRIDNNRFYIDNPTISTTAGTVAQVNRWGRQASPFGAQLEATKQIDWEGNQHGLSNTVVSTPGGGVVTNPNPVIRPPVIR